MKIGILQTGHVPDEMQPEYGDYDRLFAQLLGGNGFDFTTFNVVDGQFPNDKNACDGWLITGSRHGVYEDHDWIAPLMELIRDIFAAKIPLVGICFGHQIIAQALGGRVEKYQDGWTIGQQTYDEGWVLNAYHQDQVIVPPKSATKISGNARCKNAFIYYGDHVFTMQPHPEFSQEFVRDLIETRAVGIVPDAVLQHSRASLSPDTNANTAADALAQVLRATDQSAH